MFPVLGFPSPLGGENGRDLETAQRGRVSHPLSLPSLTLLEARLMLGDDSSVTWTGPDPRRSCSLEWGQRCPLR